MTRLLLLAAISSIAASIPVVPAHGEERQCWLDAMTDAQKRELVLGYANVQRSQGKASAEAWAQTQREKYSREFVARGICPRQRGEQPAAPTDRDTVLNRYGKPCKRIELENQNVPNLGGAMGWALIPVCKD